MKAYGAVLELKENSSGVIIFPTYNKTRTVGAKDYECQIFRMILSITRRHECVVLNSCMQYRHYTNNGDQNEKPSSDTNYRTVYPSIQVPFEDESLLTITDASIALHFDAL